MEFPFGHHKQHHHRQEEEEQQQYPPPNYQTNRPDFGRERDGVFLEGHQHYRPQEPPQPGYYDNRFERPYPPPPPSEFGYSGYPEQSPGYPSYPSRPPPRADPEPVYSSIQHVSHEVNQGGYQPGREEFGHEGHHHRPHNPFSSVFHHTHESSEIARKPTVRVYCRAESNYSLSIRDGKVVLARADPNDEFQHWYKDEKWSIKVKDEEGFPSFSLVNKTTGQVLKHSIGATHPVQLTTYNPEALDASVLWTESRDAGDGFRAVRMVNNIRLNWDAFHGDKNHGGVHDGTILVLWEWKKGDNQKWKIVPYCKFSDQHCSQ